MQAWVIGDFEAEKIDEAFQRFYENVYLLTPMLHNGSPRKNNSSSLIALIGYHRVISSHSLFPILLTTVIFRLLIMWLLIT